MKILHVIDSGGLYGAEVMLLNLAAEQLQQGHEPIIASIGCPGEGQKPLESEALRRGISVEPFRMKSGFNVLGGWNIVRYAQAKQIDVLHSHGYKGNILLGCIPRGMRKIPVVTTLHGWTSTSHLGRMRLYEWLDGQILKWIDKVVLVSENYRNHPRLKLKADAVRVISNGIGSVDSPHGTLDPVIVDFCRGGETLAAVGRLSPEKNFSFLIRTLHLLHERGYPFRILFLGEGREKKQLENLGRELGLEHNLFFAGFRPEARHYLPLTKALVLSSLTEGLPMVVLEAMIAGTPVVSTPVGGIPEVLEHGRLGMLYPLNDMEALADILVALRMDNESLRQMVETAGAVVRKKFSSAAMATAYNEVYVRIA